MPSVQVLETLENWLHSFLMNYSINVSSVSRTAIQQQAAHSGLVSWVLFAPKVATKSPTLYINPFERYNESK